MKLNSFNLLFFLAVFASSSSFAPAEHGMYAGLVPGSSNKFVFQIVPDKTYEHVVAHINFYSSDNKRVGQKAYAITDDREKYVRKDVVTSKVFKFDFDKEVKRVAIDFVNTGEILDKEGSPKGTKIGLKVVTKALGEVGK